MMAFLYDVFIGPIQFLFEVFFALVYRFSGSKIIAIVGISLIVNFLVLPLYNKSDAIQERERLKQKEMSRWVNHIKKNFTGDKKYMMLLTYYRQQNYKPVYALRGSFSLLLQIPFFIAAYNFLSTEGLLDGVSLLFIRDLSKPDQLFTIGGFAVNCLPILMTIINFVAGYIYTKDFPIKEQVQLYLTAVVFLVLLYTSPSGLVFYWILNNLFSLVKNIVKPILAKKKKTAGAASSEKKHRSLIPETILGRELFKKKSALISVVACLYISLVCGLQIPLSVISASPWDFTYSTHGWMDILLNTLGVYVGLAFWIMLIYSMVSDRVKYYMSMGLFIISMAMSVNVFYFNENYGGLTDDLVYTVYPAFYMSRAMINILVMVVIAALCYIIYTMKNVIARALLIILMLTVSVASVLEVSKINSATGNTNNIAFENIDQPIISLSTEGENVVFIMIDRASGFYFPQILEEKPELAQRLEGFVFYPNTMSYGPSTNFTTPALFGGYEYTPVAMDSRDNESLQDKQNEALSVLPVLFSNNSFDVTVCDPPYAGDYSVVPDVSIYDQYENITGYVTNGNVINDTYRRYAPTFMDKQMHNFIAFSLFRSAPNIVRPYIYHVGDYRGIWDSCVTCAFLDAYTVLEELDNLTNIQQGNQNNFLMFQNATSHEPVYLAEPDYVPQLANVRDISQHDKGYDVNMAAILQLANWIDYLKENGVYDNTRIIIVADHGHKYDETEYAYGFFNPLLLVKDFNGTGDLTVSDSFMTNADVPYLATQGVIDNPVNPFTGNTISMSAKDEPIYAVFSTHYNTLIYHDNRFDVSDGTWFNVINHDMLDPANWVPVEDPRGVN